MDTLVFSLAYAFVSVGIFLAARLFDQRITYAAALLAAVYLGLDDLLTGLPSGNDAFALVGGDWNWSGKIYSIVLSVLAIIVLRIRPEEVGLRLKQDAPRLGLAAVLGFIVWGACLGLLFQPGAADAETLIFQASMPGIAEELVYRGIAPAILMGMIMGRGEVGRMPWAAIGATAVLFGVWHGLSFSEGSFDFDLMSGLFPFIGSVVGGWLRFKTGSLLVPVLGHGLANVAFHIAGMIGT